MRRLVTLLFSVAVTLAVVGMPALAAPTTRASPSPAAQPRAVVAVGVAQQQEIEAPEQWEAWDSDGDGVVTVGEFRELGEEGQDEVRDWVHDVLLEDHPHEQGREWGNAHFDWMTYWALDFPAPGFGDQVREAPGAAIEAGREVVEDVGETAADSALGAVADAMGGAASDLAGYLGDELAQTGRPQLEAAWYQEHYQRMLGWAALLMLPLAFGAIGTAVARGDTAQVGQTILQVPIAYLMGLLGVSLVHAAAGLSVAMARSLVPSVEGSSGTIGERVAGVLVVQPQMGQGVILLLGLAIALAALATLMWLLFTEAAVYAAVLFFPLAFAGRVWPATANWGRRLLTIALALIGARVVIFALWGMAMSGLEEFTGGDVPLRSALALMALLVMTAVAPTAALRLVPLVEGAEVAPTPGGATQRVLGVGYQAMSLARTGGMASRGGGGRLPVTSNIAGAAPQVPSKAAAAGRGVPGPNSSATRAASSGRPPSGGTSGGDGSTGPGSPAGGGPSSRGPAGSGGPRRGGSGGDGQGGGKSGASGGEAAADGGRPRDGGASRSAGPRAPRVTPRPLAPPPRPSEGRRGPGRRQGGE